jgi:hypothetical protein
MLNRVSLIGLVVALGFALGVSMLINSAIGPRASQADFVSTSISIGDIQQRVDQTMLPIHSIPEP